MSRKSYNVNDHTSPRDMVHRQFIENVIKGLRVTGDPTKAWFNFTSQDRNITEHDAPNITDKTRHIYFFIPPHARFVSATQFLEIMKSGDFTPSDPLPKCYYEAVKRGAFLKTIYKKKAHPCPESIGKKRSDNITIMRSSHVKYTSLKKDIKTFGELLSHRSFCRYFDKDLFGVLKTKEIPEDQSIADFREEHADDLEIEKIKAFLEIVKKELKDDNLDGIYKDFIENRNSRGLPEFIEILKKEFTEVLITQAHDDFNKFQKSRIEAREDLHVKTSLKDHVTARVATVCQHLPEHRPITLTIPLHFGGHYHTYNARIYNDHVELQAITTIRGYKDKDVLSGMKEGILAGTNKTPKFSKETVYESQRDGVSCGPTSTTVSISTDPAKTLKEQAKALKTAVASYRGNRPGVKAALADIHYAVSGLTLRDEHKSKKPLSADQIMMETMRYCSLYNKTRPCTFGLRIRNKKHLAVYAIRITDDHAEILSISNHDINIDEKNVRAIQHGIQAALAVDDDFFQETAYFDYNPAEDDISGKAETELVATRIDPSKNLDSQAQNLANTIIGEEKFHKALRKGEHESIFSFQSKPLTEEQIIAKQAQWEIDLQKALMTKYVKPKPPARKKKSSGDDDDESSAHSSSSAETGESLSVDNTYKKIQADIKETEELEEAFNKRFKHLKKTKPHLPLPILFERARKGVISERKRHNQGHDDANLNRALQYAAVDILQDEYERQQDKKEHDHKVAVILSCVFFFIPGISHAFIWGIFSAMHSKDVKKLRLNRDSYNEYVKASTNEEDFKADQLINSPTHTPLKKVENRMAFRKVFGEGKSIADDIPGEVHVYFWNGKKAKAFEKDFHDWEKHEAPDSTVSSKI